MTLAELFKRLSYGELSNLSISGEGSGTIIEGGRQKILVHLNDALTVLFTRFILNEKSLIVKMLEGKTQYYLRPEFAASNAEELDETYPYIMDSVAHPYTGDLIRILGVSDDNGYDLPLNDRTHKNSVFSPQPGLLEVPNPDCSLYLALTYQAKHDAIVYENEESLEAVIDIPLVLEQALTAYIGWKIFSNMNTQESLVKSQELFQHYEARCVEAENKDLMTISNSATNIKFYNRGWV